jgi:hypothetical protein
MPDIARLVPNNVSGKLPSVTIERTACRGAHQSISQRVQGGLRYAGPDLHHRGGRRPTLRIYNDYDRAGSVRM